MTGDTESPREARRLLWFWDVAPGLVWAVVAIARMATARVLSFVVRTRTRGDRRLVSGSPERSMPVVPGLSGGPDPGSRATRSSGGAPAGTGIAATRRPQFSIVRVDPAFSPGVYARTFAALQRAPSTPLFDLVPARLLCADIFERLAEAWTATADTVPRLGILVSFERWVMLRETALAALQPLIARGVRVEVFYEEQAAGGHLPAWFAHGQVVHDVGAVVATLAARWQPGPSWPQVLDTLIRLVRAYASTGELPALLTEIAGLALSCGGAEQAAMLAREALYYLPDKPSATRSQALRELGAALIAQGQTAGLALLDQAIAMASIIRAPTIGTTALCQRGLYALNHGDYPSAERRFRGAIELLSTLPRRPHLLALAHHNLAIALMHQGHPDAEHHARTALALREDQESFLAEEDRMLLSKLREVHAEAH